MLPAGIPNNKWIMVLLPAMVHFNNLIGRDKALRHLHTFAGQFQQVVDCLQHTLA